MFGLSEKATKRIYLLMLVLSGILTGLTVAIPSIGFLEWVSLAPAAYVLIKLSENREVKLRRLYLYGFALFYPFMLVVFHWFLFMYPMEFLGITKTAAGFTVVFCWLGLALFQAVQGALVVLFFGAVARYTVAKKCRFVLPFLAAALWAVFEWLLTFGWFGVPWGRLALGQSEMLANLQSASLFGSYFVTFLIVAVNFLVALIFIMEHKSQTRVAAILAVSLLLVNTFFGIINMSVYSGRKDKTLKVAAIQANISTDDKWSIDALELTLERYGELSREAAKDGAKVIVWSETALPYSIETSSFPRAEISSIAADCNATLLVGAFAEEIDGKEGLYNVIVQFYPDGTVSEEYYIKQRLVPFGEFVPMRSFIETCLPFLSDLALMYEDITPGDESFVFDTNEGKIGSIVCFDSIYENLILESVKGGAQLLAVSTNDGWFKDSRGVYMHYAQSQLRAIESGRCIVRSANTGVSGIIKADGSSVNSLAPLTDGYVCEDISLHSHRTLYSYIGNLFVYLCIAYVAVLIFINPLKNLFNKTPKKSLDKNPSI